MVHNLQNNGVKFFNKSQKDENQKTIIVVGVERSGTSMVGTVLNELGVFLGNSHDKAVYEDIQTFTALENENYTAFEELVNKNNSDHEIWGWKRPQSYKYSERYLGRVRNPHFIVLFRDSFSIAMRNSISVHTNVTNNLLATAHNNLELCKFVANCKAPMLCVSYEKAMSKKLKFMHSLVDYLGLDISLEKQKKVVSSMVNGKSEYLDKSSIKKTPKQPLMGRIDHISEQTVSGWAKIPNQESQVTVELLIDGDVVQEQVANIFRLDLKDRNVGDGHYAYSFDTQGGNTKSITVRVKENGQLLNKPKS